jgi:hypothetical protein
VCVSAFGAGRVDYIDVDANALALAKSLGANVIEGPPPKRAGTYPITVDASQDPMQSFGRGTARLYTASCWRRARFSRAH